MTKECPHCRAKSPDEAEKCQFCGKSFDEAVVKKEITDKNKENEKKESIEDDEEREGWNGYFFRLLENRAKISDCVEGSLLLSCLIGVIFYPFLKLYKMGLLSFLIVIWPLFFGILVKISSNKKYTFYQIFIVMLLLITIVLLGYFMFTDFL